MDIYDKYTGYLECYTCYGETMKKNSQKRYGKFFALYISNIFTYYPFTLKVHLGVLTSYVYEVKGHVNLFSSVQVQLQLNLICRCNIITSYLVSGWGLVQLCFCVSYYDIGVPCQLLPPCQGDRASLLAVF